MTIRNLPHLTLIALALVVGCKKQQKAASAPTTHEEVARDVVSSIERVTAALNAAKDDVTANQAVQTITAEEKTLGSLSQLMSELGPASPAQQESVKKHEAALSSAAQGFAPATNAFTTRVQAGRITREVGARLSLAVGEYSRAMGEFARQAKASNLK